ncbi:MAG: IgGFc-binding protein [Kofleriaceae bacterium]
MALDSGSSRCLLCIVIVLAACGSKRPGDDFGNGDDDGGSGVCATNLCSPDLHDVVDCQGNIIQQCADGLGCASGACVDPCAAAAANTSSVGCDYYAVNPDSYITANGSCFAAYIANTWNAPVSINVEYNGQQLDTSVMARIPTGQGTTLQYTPLIGGMLQPNQVAILFLAWHQGILTTACPTGITAGYTATDAAAHGTALGHAFHITTSAPVVAYDIFPYGGGTSAITSATLLLPTSAWDTNYVAVDGYAKSTVTNNPSQPFIEIVGKEDATHVTIRPKAAIVGGTGVPAAAANSNAVYTLAKGQVMQMTQDQELMGSVITSDAPVGVWGGNACMNIPTDVVACDAAHQQIPPVKAMGNRYAAVRYRNRWPGQEETPPWRLVGGVDGTTLTYKPSAPAGAPTSLGVGQMVEFTAAGPFTVESQDTDHPFYMSAHMTGCELLNPAGDDCRGDPEFVNVVPPDQYLSAYTFFTDPTYPETDLVITRERDGGQFADVNLDCVGTVSGWLPVDAADNLEYARVDLVTGNFQGVGTCNNGLHVATSPNKFGLVVWGWGSAATGLFSTQAVSYAYPAGMSIKPINNVVIE